MTTYNMDSGEAKTFAFDVQGIADMTELKVYIGSKRYDLIESTPTFYLLKLSANESKKLGQYNIVSAVIESPTIALQKATELFAISCKPSNINVDSDDETDIISVTAIISVTEQAISVESILYDVMKGTDGIDGVDGATLIPTQAWASDAAGTGWSLTPTSLLKYTAWIPWDRTSEAPPTATDYAGALWQKVVGENGVNGTGVPVGPVAENSPYAAESGAVYTENQRIKELISEPTVFESAQDGLCIFTYNSATGVSGYAIEYYKVVAGNQYLIKGSFTSPSPGNTNIGVYSFYTSPTYTSGIAGSIKTQSTLNVEYDHSAIAPLGANYIGISRKVGVDDITAREVINLELLASQTEVLTVKVDTTTDRAERDFDFLSEVIPTETTREGYVIPYYLWEEADVNYRVVKYPVVVGRKYRVRAQVTSKAVGQGTMGAYCFYKEISVPLDGGITVQPQLKTIIHDKEVVCPDGAKYLNFSQKIDSTDYNNLSEIITTESLKYAIGDYRDIITCDGDSITWGAAPEDGLYWTKLLQTLIGTSKRVINCGVGGESAVNIPMRQGAIPMYNSIEFTLPADTSAVPVGRYDAWFYSNFFRSTYDNEPCSFLLQGEGRDYSTINPCIVDGIECTLSYVSESNSPTQGQYYIKRNQAGTARTIKVGTVVSTNAARNLKRGASVIFIGTNDGWVDTADLISRIKRMASFADCGKNFVIIGIYGGTAKVNHSLNKAAFEAMEAEFTKQFGLNYLNLRKYTIEHGLADEGIQPTQADLDAIALGDIPPSLLADSVHPNAAFSRIIAKQVYLKLISIGAI